jgi:hypothetical protein
MRYADAATTVVTMMARRSLETGQPLDSLDIAE